MMTKITTIAVFATLYSYAIANYERTKSDSESDGYFQAGGEFIDKSNVHDDSVSEESGRCGRNVDSSNNHHSYERIEPYEKGSRQGEYSSPKASASASADASSNAYDHGHKDRIFL